MTTVTPPQEKLLTRIGGLLRQAESSKNTAEAETYLAKAQRLAAQSSIDLAIARAHTPARLRRITPIQRTIKIGEQGKRGLRTFVELFLAIAHANDLKVDVFRNSTAVIAFGYADDIDAVETLYNSLAVQMVSASTAYLATGAHRPASGVSARISFQIAFASRIGDRLREARKEAEQEAIQAEAADTNSPTTGTEIALRNKEIEIRDFYATASGARGSWRAHGRRGNYLPCAANAGDRAAQKANLGGARTALPHATKAIA